MARPNWLPKFMLVAYALSAPTCINRANEDEWQMWTNKFLITVQCDKFYSESTISAVGYKPSELRLEHMNFRDAVKQSDNISNTIWYKDLTCKAAILHIGTKFINILTKSKARGTYSYVRLGRRSTHSSLKRRLTDQFTQPMPRKVQGKSIWVVGGESSSCRGRFRPGESGVGPIYCLCSKKRRNSSHLRHLS